MLFLFLNSFAVGGEEINKPEVSQAFRDFHDSRAATLTTLKSSVPSEVIGRMVEFAKDNDKAAEIVLQKANLRGELSARLQSDRDILRNMLQIANSLDINDDKADRDILRNILQAANSLDINDDTAQSSNKKIKDVIRISDLPNHLTRLTDVYYSMFDKWIKAYNQVQDVKQLKKRQEEFGGVRRIMSNLLRRPQRDFDSEIRSLEAKYKDASKDLGQSAANRNTIERLIEYASKFKHKSPRFTTQTIDNYSDIFPDASTDELRALLQSVKNLNEEGELASLLSEEGKEKLLNFNASRENWKNLKIPVNLFDVQNLNDLNRE